MPQSVVSWQSFLLRSPGAVGCECSFLKLLPCCFFGIISSGSSYFVFRQRPRTMTAQYSEDLMRLDDTTIPLSETLTRTIDSIEGETVTLRELMEAIGEQGLLM